MLDGPRVTVGIPFWNSRSTLLDAVRSVFAQSYPHWELVLLDDGSTDGSSGLVKAIHDERVRLVIGTGRKGVAERRNEIIGLTETEFLAWLDADDMMHPERLEKQVMYLTSHPVIDVVGAAAYTIDAANRIRGIRGDGPLIVDAARVLRRGLFLNPTVMGRTAWFKANLYNPTLWRSEDHELWVRSLARSHFGKILEPLSFYREGPTVNLANYLQGNRATRGIIRQYGPALIGSLHSRLSCCQLALKNGLYRTASALGLQSLLVARRNRKPNGSELAVGERTVANILQTDLPVRRENEPSSDGSVPRVSTPDGTPIRLLHVTTVPQTLGFLTRLVRHGKERGYDIHALSSPGERLKRFEGEAGVPVWPVPMVRRITPLRDLLALARIVQVIRRVRPHIVHGQTPKGGLLAILAGWMCRVPVRIYHLYGLPMATERGPKRLLLRWTEKVSCGLAHQILCVSHSLRSSAVEDGLCPAEKIKVLLSGNVDGTDAVERYNPATLPPNTRHEVRSRYGIPADALVVGFAGRMVRDKGIAELVGAWHKLRGEWPNLHLLIVGAPEPHAPLPPEIEQALLGDPRIHLTGWCRGIAPLYAAMDIFVLPTYREGFGTVMLEAAAMNLPVVASRVTGCIDAVQDGVTGILVTVRDSDALAAGLRTYLRDPDLRQRHGQAGRARVLREFRPEDMRVALYAEYARLLKDKGLLTGSSDDTGLRASEDLVETASTTGEPAASVGAAP